MNKKISRQVAGFTIAEVLVCLAIFALILTAVATAFSAAGNNYNQNRDMSDAMNTARLALTRMTTEMRSAKAIADDDPAGQCSIITSNSEDVVFRYNSGDKKLYIDKNGNSYTLCENVENLTFTPHTDAHGNVKSVEMSITVKPGARSETMSSAVVLRKMI